MPVQAQAQSELEFTTFEARFHDEIDIYGSEFVFALEAGQAGTPEHRSYLGELTVGGLLHESEDIDGTVVRYWAKQQVPSVGGELDAGTVTGEFVMGWFTVERLKEKARRAVSLVEEKATLAAVFGALDATAERLTSLPSDESNVSQEQTINPDERYL